PGRTLTTSPRVPSPWTSARSMSLSGGLTGAFLAMCVLPFFRLLRHVREQRHEPRVLHGALELALVARAVARALAREHLPLARRELGERLRVLPVDVADLGAAEAAPALRHVALELAVLFLGHHAFPSALFPPVFAANSSVGSS